MCDFVTIFLELVWFRKKKTKQNIRVTEAVFKELTQPYKINFKRGNKDQRKDNK